MPNDQSLTLARDAWCGIGDVPPPPEGHFTPEAMLSVLVGFDTVSSNGNLNLITWIADYLRFHGLSPVMQPDTVDPAKVNLTCRIGPDESGGVVLSGHTDVVPVSGQDWSSNPFQLQCRDGRFYGRGSADMKGFDALCLALVPEIKVSTLTRPIILAFSYDEEVGCFGAPGIVGTLMSQGALPALAIIGEPTLMRLVNAHKGTFSFETVLTGIPAHSSQPHLGTSANRRGAALVSLLYQEADRLIAEGPRNQGFDPRSWWGGV